MSSDSTDSTARRVWILSDCGDQVSIHATEAGAELARVALTAKAVADVGDEWAASHDLHISVYWQLLRD